MSKVFEWFPVAEAGFAVLRGFLSSLGGREVVLGLCALAVLLLWGLWVRRRSSARFGLLRSKKDQARFDVRGVQYEPRMMRWRPRRGR